MTSNIALSQVADRPFNSEVANTFFDKHGLLPAGRWDLWWGPCVWALVDEMCSNQIRSAALGIAVFAQSIANCTVTMSFPKELGVFGRGAAYGIYLIIDTLWCVSSKSSRLSKSASCRQSPSVA